jgi:hypothetical protein
MADKYLLQVTAGPSYDEKTHQIVKVNEPTPLQISSPLIDANVTVRIQNYRGTLLSMQIQSQADWTI